MPQSERIPAATPLERFRALVRIPTISRLDVGATEWEHFHEFRATLADLYPLVHATCDLELVAGHSMLFRWAGSAPSGSPTVLMAHYDVVPASEDGWRHPPFAANLTGAGAEAGAGAGSRAPGVPGHDESSAVLWGRGTIDDKGSLVAIMEAVEQAIGEGVRPTDDLYLSFGHDEETVGSGARAIVALLAERGIRPALVLDEGGAVVEGAFPGVTRPMAVVGVSEKGIASVVLAVDHQGGHASTPPRLTATGRLARAIVRLDRSPFPSAFPAPTIEMMTTLAPHASGAVGLAFARAKQLAPLLLRVFDRLGDETRAMTRTTHAVTMLSGSAAANVLAERAEAVVNVRVAVGSSVAEATAHLRRAIRDPAVSVTVRDASEPSPVSPTSGAAWDALGQVLAETHSTAILTPYVMLGASDGRHFTRVSDHVYRFTPFELSSDERAALHAVDERIHVDTWERGIRFYRRLIDLR